MKLHRLRYHDSDEGTCYSWHAASRAAWREGRRRAESGATDCPLSEMNVEVVIMPTTRDGMLAWLNRDFTTDNG